MVSNISFSDIKAIAENGIFVAGGPLRHGSRLGRADSATACGSLAGRRSAAAAAVLAPYCQQQQQQHMRQYSISGITIERVQLQLVSRSQWPGGCQDYRPSSNVTDAAEIGSDGSSSATAAAGAGSQNKAWWPAGLDCSSHSTTPLWVAGAEHVLLSDVQVGRCGLGCWHAWQHVWAALLAATCCCLLTHARPPVPTNCCADNTSPAMAAGLVLGPTCRPQQHSRRSAAESHHQQPENGC